MTPHNDSNIDESNITEQVDSRLDDLFGDEDVTPADSMPSKTARTTGEVSPATRPAGAGRNDVAGADSFLSEHQKNPMETAATDITTHENPKVDAARIESSPINELKSIILSLEWEISDPVMEKLEEEIRKLEIFSRNDKIMLAFLQLLGSLGKYIRKQLARAHVDSITLLHAVYESLEKAMLAEGMSDAAKKKMLIAHLTEYKKLKQEIQSGKKQNAGKKMPLRRTPASAIPSFPSPPTREIPTDFKDLSHMARELLYAMKELQQTIQHEFSMLRAEMQRLPAQKK